MLIITEARRKHHGQNRHRSEALCPFEGGYQILRPIGHSNQSHTSHTQFVPDIEF